MDMEEEQAALIEEEFLLLSAAVLLVSRRALIQAKEKQPRRFWSRNWLLERPYYGQYEKLLAELRTDDTLSFTNFLRVNPDLWQELLHVLQCVGPEKRDTFFRKEPGLRLAITLRFMATGDSYKSL